MQKEDKASACNAGNQGLIPGSGRSPGEGNGNPLQYSCLENPVDRGAWLATVHGVTKSQTRLSDNTHPPLRVFIAPGEWKGGYLLLLSTEGHFGATVSCSDSQPNSHIRIT